nr:uncharacterized protein CI109_000539 [Kwoniella shandongensis]KAA5530967.1 hypothetical protein CI109_000539 [Kwoniella shandongensis]
MAMSKVSYRERRVIMSDSEDGSDSGSESIYELAQETFTPKSNSTPVRLASESPSIPPPSVPRLNFSNRLPPLTPRRTVAFAPTPMKKLDFSKVKMRATPGKKLAGMKILGTLQNEVVGRQDENGMQAKSNLEQVDNSDKVDSLDLGALKLDDREEESQTLQEIEDVFQSDVEAEAVEEDLESGCSDPSGENSSPQFEDHIIQPNSAPPSPHHASGMAHTFTSSVTSPRPSSSTRLREDVNGSISSSDSEPDWAPTPRRNVGRRRIVVSDSDEDSPIRQPQFKQNVVDLTESDDEEHFDNHQSADDSKRRLASKFIDDEAAGEQEDEEEDGAYYYDEDSMGSLRDFIVDDDEEDDYLEAGSSEEEEDDFQIIDVPPRSKTKSKSKSDILDDESAILHYSPPRRTLTLPDLDQLVIASSDSNSDSESASVPVSKRKEKLKSSRGGLSKRDWAIERERIASGIFEDLDKKVFEGKLGSAGVGARVEWNKRLLTTAGVARSKRVTKNGESKKEHWIELSEKVLTGKEQILNTVAHEMCHLATWVISNEYKNPHGRIFKSWGRKIMKARKDIEVTTTHAYVIEYKYEWKCSTERCGKIYKRHSKLYLKANMKFAKAAMPGSSHGDVMRALSKRWTEAGAASEFEHEVYWRDLASKA